MTNQDLANFILFWILKKYFIISLRIQQNTMCPRSSDPFYIVSYYIKWVTTSWTHSSWAPCQDVWPVLTLNQKDCLLKILFMDVGVTHISKHWYFLTLLHTIGFYQILSKYKDGRQKKLIIKRKYIKLIIIYSYVFRCRNLHHFLTRNKFNFF